MHNRELTRIVKTDSLSKLPKLVVRTKFAIWEKLLSKLKKSFYETTMQKLDLRLLKIQIL